MFNINYFYQNVFLIEFNTNTMAAVTASAVGLASAGFQAYQGFKQQKDAKNALNNYNRQDLSKSNAFDNTPISTVGSDLMRQESQQTSANVVNALQGMGTRGIAMLPGVVANTNAVNQEARGYLDNQINVRNNAIANDNIDIRRMKEERENADLAGIGNQMQVGSQNMWSGIRGAGASLMSAATNMGGNATSSATDFSSNSMKNKVPSSIGYKPNLGF